MVHDMLTWPLQEPGAAVLRVSDLATCTTLMREIVDYHRRDCTASSLLLSATSSIGHLHRPAAGATVHR